MFFITLEPEFSNKYIVTKETFFSTTKWINSITQEIKEKSRVRLYVEDDIHFRLKCEIKDSVKTNIIEQIVRAVSHLEDFPIVTKNPIEVNEDIFLAITNSKNPIRLICDRETLVIFKLDDKRNVNSVKM